VIRKAQVNPAMRREQYGKLKHAQEEQSPSSRRANSRLASLAVFG
jgi:hypothetical protein